MFDISLGLNELLHFTSSTEHISVVAFTTTWCGPCQRAKPIFNFMASNLANETRVKFIAVDGDRQPECVSRFRVTGFPTFLIYHGNTEYLRTHIVEEVNGQIDRWIDELVPRTAPAVGDLSGVAGMPSLPSSLSDKVTEHMIRLCGLASGKDLQKEAAAEALRKLMTDKCKASFPSEPFGLSLLPFLGSTAASDYSVGVEVLFSTWVRLESQATGESSPYRGLASATVSNILRYMIQMALFITWDHRDAIDVLHSVFFGLFQSSPTAQKLMLESPFFFNSAAIENGGEMESMTILGAFLGIGPISRLDGAGRMRNPLSSASTMAIRSLFYPENTSAGIDGSPEAALARVRITSASLASKNDHLVAFLLRSKVTRSATLIFFGQLLRLNEGYQKTLHQHLPLSSLYCMMQAQHVLLNAALPIFQNDQGKRPSQRLSPLYLLDDDPATGEAIVTFPKDVERVSYFDESNPLPNPWSDASGGDALQSGSSTSPTGSAPRYTPAVHLFFLAVRALTVYVVPEIELFDRLGDQLRYRSSQIDEKLFQAMRLLREGFFSSPTEATLRLTFADHLANWLLDVMEVDRSTGVLPESPPKWWNILPQEVVDAPLQVTALAAPSASYTPQLFGLLLVLMGNEVYFPKPRAQLFTLFIRHIVEDQVANRSFQNHPWFSSHIVRSCMNCYMKVEKVYHERVQVRYELSILLKEFLDSPSLAAAVEEEMNTPGNTSLERFSHMAVAELNEAIDEITMILQKMNKMMKDGADTSENPSTAIPRNRQAQGGREEMGGSTNNSQQRGEHEESDEENDNEDDGSEVSYHSLGLRLKSYIMVFFGSTDLFMTLTRHFPAGVSQNMVAQQLSQVMARSLVSFAGRQSGQLKIEGGERYHFEPRKILTRLVTCLSSLTSSDFLRCLCECGVPKNDIIGAVDYILQRDLVPSTHQLDLQIIREAIIRLSDEVEKERALWDDAPDFALDAILSDPLVDIIALPADIKDLEDLVFVNRKTMHHMLLSDTKHPFTKEYLDEAMLNEFNERPEIKAAVEKRRAAVQAWLTQAKKEQ